MEEKNRDRITEMLINKQKNETIARLVGGVAHDFNNIISVISGNAQLCLMMLEESNQELKEHVLSILKASERASKLIKQLLITSKRHDMEFKILNINKVIKNLLNLLKETIGENIQITTALDKDITYIMANETNIEQVILNLAVNAKDAMPNGGKIFIKTENIEISEKEEHKVPVIHTDKIKPGKYVKINFEDTGVGIPRENLYKIFEPYFTTKPKEVGTGLGLAVVLGVIEKHNGYINVESEVGKGTKFTIYLPAISEMESIEHEKAEYAEYEKLKGNGEIILYVEDEDELRKIVSEMLSSSGYRVISCKSVKEALKQLKKHRDEIQLLFSDTILTDGHGLELAKEASKQYPDLKVLLTSGYSDSTVRLNRIRASGYDYIPKPYSMVELLGKIKEKIS